MDDEDAGATSQEGREEEDEEDYEGTGGKSRLLGFMFGNVDDSGGLDVDYLDEDAKEHLAALADKLGPSITDIELRNSSHAPNDEEDYDEKAEDAIDYEDFDEQYDGPEIQEEDHLLPKKDYFSSVTLASLDKKSSVFDEDNYDEDDEITEQVEAMERNVEGQNIASADREDSTKDNEVMVTKADVPSFPSEGDREDSVMNKEAMETRTEVPNIPSVEREEKEAKERNVEAISFPPGEQLNIGSAQAASLHGSLSGGSQEGEDIDFDFEEFQEEPNIKQDQADSKSDIPLPILCVEDGKVILKFSEIFGIHEPLRKAEKTDLQRHVANKERIKDEEFDVEEDEADFLRSTSYDISKIKFPPAYDSEVDNDVPDAFSNVNEHIKDSCVCAEPMKDDSALNISTCQLSTPISEVYPLDHESWENSIVWGNSPASSHGCSEEFDSELEARYTHEDAHENTNPNIKDNNFLVDPVIVEAFGSRNSLYAAHPFSDRTYHPQLLRLDTAQDNNIRSNKDIGKVCKENLMHRFNRLSLRNKDLLEGSWLDQVVWDPDQPIPKPKLILDLQDEQMLFEISDDKDSEHLFSHARAMLMMRSSDFTSGDSFDPHNQGTRFNISNDKYYSSRKISMQAKSHPKKRSINGIKVLHSVPALKLQTMKPKLNNKEVANFHRPKALWYPRDNKCIVKAQGALSTEGAINILLSSLGGGKTIKIDINAEENVSTVISKASKKLDIKPSEKVKVFYCGKELKDDESLGSQRVCPNSMLHLVRTKIHVWPRAQKLPGENKPLRPPGAFKKKTDLSVKDGHVFLMEYCEERPLLIGNVGMGARLCTYYQKMASNDQTASSLRNENDGLGTILTLEPSDKSPFLGEIGSGCSQSCLETNMYRAPVFPHKSSTTDYLLVRSAKGVLSLRRIDKLYSVGQQEPHMEVPSPASAKVVQTHLVNRMLAYVYRAFRSMDKPDIIPSIRVDDLAALFPDLTDAIVRKRLKHCADVRRGKDGVVVWSKRRDFRIPNEEKIRGICTPENVCCYESMQAGLYRLKRLGISGLLHPNGLSSAMNQLPDEAIALAAASHIERELQITPWNLTSNFVACTTHNKENIERLEITGVGDPSGRGLGFSFVRVTPKATMSNATLKKKITTKVNSTVTGTDADLRRLSMGAACEVLLKFNVPQEEIDKLTRWHRIAKIRQLSSEQAATGMHVDAMTINKFARGQKLSYLQLQQQAREKCQEIWDRQVQSLSATNGDEIDSETEANSDLDSFAGDLENLLDAEEFDEVEDDNMVSKGDKADIVRGRKTRRCHLQSQTEEEIEDDEEEAGFLLRLLQDDEGEVKKKIPPKETGQNLQQVSDNIYLTKKTNQNISMARPEIVLTPKEIKFNDSKEMENFLLERNLSGKFITSKVLKEKKEMVRASCRDSFICGACGQHGHMRTNKNCPKYGEDPEAAEFETLQVKTYNPDIGHQLSLPAKTSFPKMSLKVAEPEFSENTGLKSSSKVKFKVGSSDKVSEKNTDVECNKPVKISKLVISNKMKSDDGQHETRKPSFIDIEEDRPPKKIIFKQPRTHTDSSPLDENYDIGMGYEYKKTKKITELSLENHQNNNENIWHDEEDDIIGEAIYEERPRNYEARSTKNRFFEEHHSLLEASGSGRYGEFAWNAGRKSSKKKKAKKKKTKPDFSDDYILDHKSYRKERRVLPERERGSKRRPIIDPVELDYAHPSKRQRGAEVMLSNILETIVESLRDTVAISFLFLKPVTKKEAPDYFDIVQRPMDLSTIRDKVRNMEYKSREEFRHDVWQITYNAHIYNDGRNPGIPPLADQLLELCDFHLQEKDYALTKAESAIDR